MAAALGVVYASFFGVVGFEGVVLVLYVAYVVVFVAGYVGLYLLWVQKYNTHTTLPNFR